MRHFRHYTQKMTYRAQIADMAFIIKRFAPVEDRVLLGLG